MDLTIDRMDRTPMRNKTAFWRKHYLPRLGLGHQDSAADALKPWQPVTFNLDVLWPIFPRIPVASQIGHKSCRHRPDALP
jgi:hypothetical protein